MRCMSLNKNNLRAHAVKYVHGFRTGETVGYIVYYRIRWDNIIASMPKSPEQNHQPSKKCWFVWRLCTVFLAYLMLYSIIIIFYIIKIIPTRPHEFNGLLCTCNYIYNYAFIKQSVNKFVQYMYVNCSSIHTFRM